MMAALLLVGVPARASVPACQPFADVTADNPFCTDIAWLSAAGITTPVGDAFRPTDTVTRGEMTAFLYRLAAPGQAQPACVRAPFPDVPATNAFCAYVAWAGDIGLVNGYLSGLYQPSGAVDRASMAAFLYRIARPGTTPAGCTVPPFSDVAVTSVFCGAIAWLKGTGITLGIDGTRYGPADPVTRQSMAAFLHRLSDTGSIKAVPTAVTTSTPFFPDGRIRLRFDGQSYDFGGGWCTPSLWSTAPNVYRCGSTADHFPACWPTPMAGVGVSIYCLHDPDDATLARSPGSPGATAPADPNGVPWQIVLDDGSVCRARVGGAWPQPAGDYYYTYGCDGPTGGLAAPGSGSTVTTTSPHWRAYATRDVADGAPIITVGVRKAVYAGAAPAVAPAQTGAACAPLSAFPASLAGGLIRGTSPVRCVGEWAAVRYLDGAAASRDVIFRRISGTWSRVADASACSTPGSLPAALYYQTCSAG